MHTTDLLALAHTDVARLALAALIVGIVMTVASRNAVSKLHGFLYLAATAAIVYTHHWDLIYAAMGYGLVASILLMAFTRRRRPARA